VFAQQIRACRGSNFTITGAPLVHNEALIDAGTDLRPNPHAAVWLYQVRFGSN
jgi:uncharacterized protein with beta-barrel porin domain